MPRVRSGLGAVADGPRTNWNPATCNTDNEEGNLFVPGRDLKILPTIRIENFRDGVEDLWYYRMLEELVKQAERKSGFDKALLARSQKALAVPESLILSTDQYNTEPEALRSIRRELAECMEEMQKKTEIKGIGNHVQSKKTIFSPWNMQRGTAPIPPVFIQLFQCSLFLCSYFQGKNKIFHPHRVPHEKKL